MSITGTINKYLVYPDPGPLCKLQLNDLSRLELRTKSGVLYSYRIPRGKFPACYLPPRASDLSIFTDPGACLKREKVRPTAPVRAVTPG
jgi:hypothetical protein